ncbi:hypothetical protein ACFL1B_03955 [Nanoarchaeota archaeon]
MVLFDEFIYWLDYYGAVQVLLPFILVFALIYAILNKSKIMGRDSKRINTIISLVMGLMVIAPHVLGLPGYDVVDIINQAIPEVSLVVVAVIMFLLLVGIFGQDMHLAGASITGWAIFLSLILVLYIFGSAAGWWMIPDVLWWLGDPSVQSLIVIILVFGLIIWFVTAEPKKSKAEGWATRFGDFFREMVSK